MFVAVQEKVGNMNSLGLWVAIYTEALGLRKEKGPLVPDFQWDVQQQACPLSVG